MCLTFDPRLVFVNLLVHARRVLQSHLLSECFHSSTLVFGLFFCNFCLFVVIHVKYKHLKYNHFKICQFKMKHFK